jgi:hypothetical protein
VELSLCLQMKRRKVGVASLVLREENESKNFGSRLAMKKMRYGLLPNAVSMCHSEVKACDLNCLKRVCKLFLLF